MVIFLILSCVAESGDLCEGNKKAAPFSSGLFCVWNGFQASAKKYRTSVWYQ
ncbi:phospholipase/carboxylesterase [Neisseria meningitidis]|uniref:Phospholipase/carboxylesterase n=1 Tax=Neisseria meningitidis TaxID=487 RepID=X5ERC2_NEIME|nr:phospholipase/carboxylesterase [Neisseria meningitidis]AOT29055.1 phospholipase [Neisseria meningitidis]